MWSFRLFIFVLLIGFSANQVTSHAVGHLRTQTNDALVGVTHTHEALVSLHTEADPEEADVGDQDKLPNQNACMTIFIIMLAVCCCGGILQHVAIYTWKKIETAQCIGVLMNIVFLGVIIWLFWTGTIQALFAGKEMSVWCKIVSVWALLALIVGCLLLCCVMCFLGGMMAGGVLAASKEEAEQPAMEGRKSKKSKNKEMQDEAREAKAEA
eukprot:gnl/TRDRNA2_/TRDRNA2_185409_c0_seq1.p1 gnl/TRDRNA2_/TRDRNA2_185409_c0~~gnl/TRDRNA2_/TRDRNA2_185409_c0_seq1.p1  ORF type:complete len:211 (+),score=47.44 gnl/TRDRNA2_/TRDRNA2_185409_c0_seq1:52-684(+)